MLSRRSSKNGFTLLELLVATAVFTIGFVAVYAMFLGGMRNRALSDSITKTSLAATSIIAEIRMRAGRENSIAGNNNQIADPKKPSDYEGNGFADNKIETGFSRYQDQPGLWYYVQNCQDMRGGDNKNTVSIRMDIIVLYCPLPASELRNTSELPLETVRNRYNLKQFNLPISDADKPAFFQELVRRRIAQQYPTVIHRQASWMP